jgi:alginate O-acetyltransferase complex protein AlgI
MDIISLKYSFFAILSVFVYYLLNERYKIGFLTVVSGAFIASYDIQLLLYVVVYSSVNYYLGLKIQNSRSKKTLFRIGVLLNLLQLIILKYSSFAIDPFFEKFNSPIHLSQLSEQIIPIGISYFTLQGIGYLINVKMGWEEAEKNFLNFLLYITYSPKFISGPIERSNHFLPQLKINHLFNEQRVVDGLRIALFGFFKKIAIANQLTPFIEHAYANLNSADGFSIWVILVIQPIYLYFDFSGYTDIAIGISKTFGIELLPNFNRPFFSENMTTFWKKFHISLSSWFNDYIFKQTSFKYRNWGIYASIMALLVTWSLFGIWHGAGWNFMILGLIQSLAIIYEFFTKKWRLSLFTRVSPVFKMWFGRIITYLFYGGSLVFFFSPNLNTALFFFQKAFEFNGSVGLLMIGFLKEISLSVLFAGIFLVFEYLITDKPQVYDQLENLWLGTSRKKKLVRWVIYYLLLTIIFVLHSEVQQFIYFQF